MNLKQAEELHRQFVAEKRENHGRIFNIKTQEYENRNNN